MNNFIYRLRDRNTNNFWNGSSNYPLFNENGAHWKRKVTLENEIVKFVTVAKTRTYNQVIPTSDNMEIVEYRIHEEFSCATGIADLLFHNLMRAELRKIHWKYDNFYEKMRRKHVINEIEFILTLAPEQNKVSMSFDHIKLCRAQLRLLGVKSRTYREYWGMFGMLNREQAMRARLTLNLSNMLDLNDVRTRIRKQM